MSRAGVPHPHKGAHVPHPEKRSRRDSGRVNVHERHDGRWRVLICLGSGRGRTLYRSEPFDTVEEAVTERDAIYRRLGLEVPSQ